ncbi:uncharacterized protein LOC102360760 [Latimeria chalumnae]|uniref:uncharacterized protein LOC102360760 n=1 Tax=Latimeria chalumnae TaxID=7897 RepID=UPI0003C13ACB|nr:PREDICTED: uncharacterized protein LOC102360760 [Latimeria chalumnae]|eukprot:XP_006001511.1 PREDICTED: uncharacterized protein LOC102360760 [Latimeria chalumnae]
MERQREQTGERSWWSEEETRALLAIISDMGVVEALTRKRQRNAAIFGHIHAALKVQGISRSMNQIRMRWKTLKTMYRKEKSKRLQRSHNDQWTAYTFQYFGTMEKLLGKQSWVRPVAQVESLTAGLAQVKEENSQVLRVPERPSNAGQLEKSTTCVVDLSSSSSDLSPDEGEAYLGELREDVACQAAAWNRAPKTQAASASQQETRGTPQHSSEAASASAGAPSAEHRVIQLLEENLLVQREILHEQRQIRTLLELWFHERRAENHQPY